MSGNNFDLISDDVILEIFNFFSWPTTCWIGTVNKRFRYLSQCAVAKYHTPMTSFFQLGFPSDLATFLDKDQNLTPWISSCLQKLIQNPHQNFSISPTYDNSCLVTLFTTYFCLQSRAMHSVVDISATRELAHTFFHNFESAPIAKYNPSEISSAISCGSTAANSSLIRQATIIFSTTGRFFDLIKRSLVSPQNVRLLIFHEVFDMDVTTHQALKIIKMCPNAQILTSEDSCLPMREKFIHLKEEE